MGNRLSRSRNGNATDTTENGAPGNCGLAALTAAALALPGMLPSVAHADAADEVGLQFGHYTESDRQLYGLKSKHHALESDSVRAGAALTISDRLKLNFNFTQDTWSGATPIATAPRDLRGNRSSALDGISGASPYLLSSGNMYLDAATLKPLTTDGSGTLIGGIDNQLAHTISGASPETRKQLDLRLTHAWDDFALDVGGGVSRENDYVSTFYNLGGRWDLNQKLTTLSLGLSYTISKTKAVQDHDATPYILDSCGAACGFVSPSSHVQVDQETGRQTLFGSRQDWGMRLGVTQVLDKESLFEAGIGFVRSTGYLSNPYKVVDTGFIDPGQQFLAPAGTYYVQFNSLLEKRPDERLQGTLDLRYVTHVHATDAAVHLSYRYFQDDWGIRAHTMEVDWAQPLGRGWTLTPKVRYYTQSAADFYVPYLITNQAEQPAVVDPVKGQVYVDANQPDGPFYFDDLTVAVPDGFNPSTGNPVVDANGNTVSQAVADNLIAKKVAFDRKKIPSHYSSDHRLSGYGSLSAGIVLSKEFAKGVNVELGYEHYTHAGSLKFGGGSEGSYSNFRSYLINLALRVDFGATSLSAGYDAVGDAGSGEAHSHHAGAVDHHATGVPAGLMFGHMLRESGAWMVGYRYMYGRQAGPMLHGTREVSDAELKANACGASACLTVPGEMNMHMHMLDITYAPSDWLNLMLMPRYVDMNMSMRGLATADDYNTMSPEINHMYMHHTAHPHTTGGVGDTSLVALFSLFNGLTHQAHLGLGVSAPTGDAGLRLRDTHTINAGYVHYGMQLGSGTWDFQPSLTYAGALGPWSWGAQANATIRMQKQNKSGFAFGDLYQASAWGGYRLTEWLTGTVRGQYTRQASISGHYGDTFYQLGPTDYSANYGGRFWDLGFGLSATISNGVLKGNQLGIEWLEPVKDDVNGYQLRRTRALSLNWSVAF